LPVADQGGAGGGGETPKFTGFGGFTGEGKGGALTPPHSGGDPSFGGGG